MPIDTNKFKAFTEKLGMQIDYSDGQLLLTAFKVFGEAKKHSYNSSELKILYKAYDLIKRTADKEHDEFWNKHHQQLLLNI